MDLRFPRPSPRSRLAIWHGIDRICWIQQAEKSSLALTVKLTQTPPLLNQHGISEVDSVIVVLGAGLTGVSTAFELKHLGFNVTLVDQDFAPMNRAGDVMRARSTQALSMRPIPL